jgi:hypothetical protein
MRLFCPAAGGVSLKGRVSSMGYPQCGGWGLNVGLLMRGAAGGGRRALCDEGGGQPSSGVQSSTLPPYPHPPHPHLLSAVDINLVRALLFVHIAASVLT